MLVKEAQSQNCTEQRRVNMTVPKYSPFILHPTTYRHSHAAHPVASGPTQNVRHFADNISNAFSWMKLSEF